MLTDTTRRILPITQGRKERETHRQKPENWFRLPLTCNSKWESYAKAGESFPVKTLKNCGYINPNTEVGEAGYKRRNLIGAVAKTLFGRV
jgi:hypothetical protein